ncbi:MAG: zinc-ribbon domain-containing protein [Coriobacteriia bacterium]|nr:zinc-ribbon domain-containing protein [Coriobacteriia bacterium]
MICPNCTAENLDTDAFCRSCGMPLQSAQPAEEPQATAGPAAYQQPAGDPAAYQQPTYQQAQPTYEYAAAATPAAAASSNQETLRLIAFILNIISTVSMGLLILPLAWTIPMTVHSYGIYKGTKQSTTAFAVCDLIFVNLISGILLLVADSES